MRLNHCMLEISSRRLLHNAYLRETRIDERRMAPQKSGERRKGRK
jgi:hypothetical protein